MATTKMKLWPGPRVLVPMATDVLLIGDSDIPKGSTGGILMSSTRTDYFDLYMNGSAAAQPFNVLNLQASQFKVGAHMMWTLPYTLRQGHQAKDANGNVSTEFPLVPNRWLITRFEYSDLTDGSVPTVVSNIIQSDALSPAGFPPPYDQSLYPKTLPGATAPVSQVGETVSYDAWTGDTIADANKVPVKAVGPGVVSWSVLYDNIQNVFSFVDDTLSTTATPAKPVYYTYSIIGWYDDPSSDLLKCMPLTDNATWEAFLSTNYNWNFGDDEDNDLTMAIAAWVAWSASHGLDGTFDPSTIDLPPQAKDAIVAWHAYWLANGEAGAQPNLAKQMLCHSMIGKVEWKGSAVPYGSGNPLAIPTVPDLTVGSTSVDAISTYIASQIEKNDPAGGDVTQIPIVARALSAFQNDLLDDYAVDPVRVENLLHATAFGKISAGSEWVVTRIESDTSPAVYTPPTKNAGRQSIPLGVDQTADLTELNTQQRALNDLAVTIQTQRAELFRLIYKEYSISGAVSAPTIPLDIKTAVLQSIDALSGNLDALLASQAANESTAAALAKKLTADLIDSTKLDEVDLPGYNLKQVEIIGFSAPTDPVVAIAKAGIDTKFSQGVSTSSAKSLVIRYTGQAVYSITIPAFQTYPAVTITETDLLAKVQFPAWKAFPKEVMSLWIETLLLDYSAASLLAVIFFDENNVPAATYNTPAGAGRTTPLHDLTAAISSQQTLIWNDPEVVGYTVQSMAEAAGIGGIIPAMAGVAFRSKQPWTPVFMDWRVKWYPTSVDAADPFKGWTLGEIDYITSVTALQDDGSFLLTGRSILDPNVAKNIEARLAPLENDPLTEFPVNMRKGLQWAARNAGSLDIMTQELSGFNSQLITKLSEATAFLSSGFANGNPNETALLKAIGLLGADYESLTSLLGTTACANVVPGEQQYAPIRSGHVQIIDINVIDAFGQVMPGKYVQQGGNANTPIQTVLWSEALSLSVAEQINSYGQLAPRLLQPSKISLDLLQGSTTDKVISNSADETSPICGWVMSNHLDNSLMVFDSDGKNLGAVIKVQSETSGADNNWSVRWDSAPGTNTPLGSAPDIENTYLAGFITELLKTGFEGAQAYDDLMTSIDSTLWTMGTYSKGASDNLSLLVGRPIAVVRAQVGVKTGGDPIYKQYWCNTGDYYNNNGVYQATTPPYLSNSFALRVGDSFLATNGVMGYFVDNNYQEFYPVYGADGQTKNLMELLRAGQNLNFEPTSFASGYTSDYMKKDPVLISTKPDAPDMVQLTMLVDPDGVIPVFAGCLPSVNRHLPFGPVTTALSNLTVSFRVGPLLLPPDRVQMPTPAEVQGNWSWKQRKDTVSWETPAPVSSAIKTGDLYEKPLTLSEGWLNLSNFDSTKEN
jgi:hypothetical protein